MTANLWEEWEIPRKADPAWPEGAKFLHARWWEARIERQKEIDASIAAKAEFEYLYDKPYVDTARFRVAGPFTVESLSPHRTLAVDWDDELIDILEAAEGKRKTGDAGRPSQAALVTREFSGPARVSGSAGTGKTIVALHRAVHLARSNPGSRVLPGPGCC